MTDYRPYSLKSDRATSDTYYQAIAAYTDEWLSNARVMLPGPVGSFHSFLAYTNQISNKVARTFDETAFEMLVLGVMLREHGCQALDMPPMPAWVLARLIETQDALPLPEVEKPIKTMRGWIQGLTEDGDCEHETPVDLKPFKGGASALVERLVTWMRSADMAAQAERMEDWAAYLGSLGEQSAQAVIARCLVLAEDFAESAEAGLGEFTRDAEAFRLAAKSCSRWRYDAPLVTRTRVEYHLGMLGTEILTREYRSRYQAASRKIVIMPDCLCAHTLRVVREDQVKCQAERTSLGGKCTHCTPGCKVWQISALGEKHGFEAYILPDDLRGVGLGSCSKLVDVGVVGIACVLTNWDAGWQVNDAGVPCQGVLLDYAGCRNHWDDEGVSTDVNLNHLLSVVGSTSYS